jgi:hypothetical protein
MTSNMTSSMTMSRFPWVLTATKGLLFILKNRIKAPRVVPAPSTGDQATDDTTRREFERVKTQLDADYQDSRALLTDLEPLLNELAEHLQGWMHQRDEVWQNMMLGGGMGRGPLALPAHLGGSPGMPGYAQDAPPQNPTAQYEGMLIKAPDADPIYKVEGGRKRWIISQEAFFRNGFKAHSEIIVPRSVVDSIPFGTNIT